ncbi:hypothetical protein [Aestuariibacter salexigens]|uniref:hypothetical protein n=1 Tax=Aestuariibacter salexigens TaxID=226010 RepID=UPI0003F62C66|nr:hypothetical protein [Aestuariibacter salexigens]
MKKFLMATAATALLSANAVASINFPGGVSLIPDTSLDLDQGDGNFSEDFRFIQWWDNSATAASADALTTLNPLDAANWSLNGIGRIGTSDTGTGELYCASCELTVQFGGIGLAFIEIDNPALTALLGPNYTQQQLEALANLIGAPTTVLAPDLVLSSSSFLNVYIDQTPDFDIGSVMNDGTVSAAEIAAATNDDLWLKLSFQDIDVNPDNFGDGVFGLSNANTQFALNVVRDGTALAQDNFVDNVIRDLSLGFDDFVDLIGFDLGAVFNNGGSDLYASNGAGTFSGVAVSAPASLGMVGLSLLLVGAAARRRKFTA